VTIARELERRRAALAAACDGVVLVSAGDPLPVPGRGDRTYPYRAHSEYLYLTDRERPGGVLAFAPDEGWVDFVVPVSPEERLWTRVEEIEGDVRDVAELEAWLAGRPHAALGAIEPTKSTAEAREALLLVRRIKDEVELERMRVAAAATRAGFAALEEALAPGITERALQLELETAFFRNGADFLAFDSIVAVGDHAAVLHFAPTDRALAARELVLVDAGAESRGYAADVTRTFVFTDEQRALHDVVARSQQAALAACRPGVEWRDVHVAAALVIADGLADAGVLRGAPESLVESGAVSLFFPHGVGHMVGLGVRDAGGTARDRTPAPGLPALRVDLPLEAGFTMTVEPGLYFVPALLAGARSREDVVWSRVDELVGLGGIRIEDDVLITADGCELLTRQA
jgi:Xaa-Pro aminopeptidase